MVEAKQREFTGKHMILVVGLFFGTIITVNLIMAYFATSSWTGLVVKNSYVASQHYNEKLEAQKAQAALGWSTSLSYQDGKLIYKLKDAAGRPVVAEFAETELTRPSHERDDQVISLFPQDGAFVAEHALASGAWDVFITLKSENGTPYIYRERISVQ